MLWHIRKKAREEKKKGQRRCPLRLVCSQDDTTSALYRHLQEQKDLSMERVSLCSDFRCQSGNTSPGSGVCWWHTCTCSHRTAPADRGEAQLCHVITLIRQAQGSKALLPLWAGAAWGHKLSRAATAWLNGHLPLWCSKISPVISWTTGSPSKTSGAGHTVAALTHAFPSSYNAKQWGGEKGHFTQVFETFLVTTNETSTSLWIKYFRFVWIEQDI